jgi:GGDEF domain-containing protein
MFEEKEGYGYLIQDIGMLIFLTVIFISTLVFSNAEKDMLLENNIMLLIMFLGIVCAIFSKLTLGIIISASQTLIYTVYKLFYVYAYGIQIKPSCYLWSLFPLLSVFSIILFRKGMERVETENNMLKQQVEELVMIDPLTGLYNLNSFYHDILAQVQYTKRNNIPMTLMIVKLRHEEELRKALNKRNYELLLQRFAEIVKDGTRIEDKIYSLNQNGELGIILTCNAEGAIIVRNRFRYNLEKKDAFEGITDRAIRVRAQIAFLEYKLDMEDDFMAFKERVEGELQYDV